MPQLFSKPKEFDFSSFVPDFLENPAKEYWNSLPEPVKKVGQFGFEALYPTEPIDQITSLMHPFGTALNVPKKALKNLSEELIDTLHENLFDPKLVTSAKDILAKHPATGFLGGNQGVRSPEGYEKLMMALSNTVGDYFPMFKTQRAKNKFSQAMLETPEKAEELLKAKRSNTVIPGVNIRGIRVREDAPDFKGTLEHELSHLGQDIAPQGQILKDRKLEKLAKSLGIKVPYPMKLAELGVRAHKRNNPSISAKEASYELLGLENPRLEVGERITEALKSMGTYSIGGRTNDFFIKEILPELMKYGRFDPKFAAFKTKDFLADLAEKQKMMPRLVKR